MRTGTSFDLDVLGARVRVPAFDASDRGWIERTADCQIQIHTLDESLTLDLQKVGARPEQGDTLLQHGAKITRANAITHLRKLQRAGIAFHRAREDRFAATFTAALELARDAYDAVLMIHVVPFMVDGDAVVNRLAELCSQASLPILHSMMGTLEHKAQWTAQFEAAGAPMFDNVEDMAGAAGMLARYRASRLTAD